MCVLSGLPKTALIVLLLNQMTSNWPISGQELILSRQKRLDDLDEASHSKARRGNNSDEDSALFRQERTDDVDSRIIKREGELLRFKRGDFARLGGIDDDAQDGGGELSRKKKAEGWKVEGREEQSRFLDGTWERGNDEVILSRQKLIDPFDRNSRLSAEKTAAEEEDPLSVDDDLLLEDRIMSREKRSNANFMHLLRTKRSFAELEDYVDVSGKEDDDDSAEMKVLSRQKRLYPGDLKVPLGDPDETVPSYGRGDEELKESDDSFHQRIQRSKLNGWIESDEEPFSRNNGHLPAVSFNADSKEYEEQTEEKQDSGAREARHLAGQHAAGIQVSLHSPQTVVEIHREKRSLREDETNRRSPAENAENLILRKKRDLGSVALPWIPAAQKNSSPAIGSAHHAAGREDKTQDNRQMFVRSKRQLQEDASLRSRLVRKWLDKHRDEAEVVRASAGAAGVDDWLEELMMREQMALMNVEYGTRLRRERLQNATLTGDLSTLSKIQRDAEEIMRRRALEGVRDEQVLKVPLKEKPLELPVDVLAEMEKERDLDTEDEPFHTRTVQLEWSPVHWEEPAVQREWSPPVLSADADVIKQELTQQSKRAKKRKKRNQRKNKKREDF